MASGAEFRGYLTLVRVPTDPYRQHVPYFTKPTFNTYSRKSIFNFGQIIF